MKTPGIGGVAWAAAGVVGLIVLVLVAGLFRLPAAAPAPPPGPRASAPPAVGLVRLHDQQDSVLREDATLRDPTPLFLPTRWNAAENALPPNAGRQPGLSFQDYAPVFTYSSEHLDLKLAAPVAVPRRPADAFATDKSSQAFAELGREDPPVPSLPPRPGFLKVVAEGSGELMLSKALTDAHPPGDSSWQPMEFVIAVNPTGLLRPPVLTESSRVSAVDGYFEEYLAKSLHLGEQLAPGFYRVCIGP